MRIYVLTIVLLFLTQSLTAQKINDPALVNLITEFYPECISGDSLTPVAHTIKKIVLIDPNAGIINSMEGMRYFEALDTLVLDVNGAYLNEFPPQLKYFYFNCNSGVTFLYGVDFNEGLRFLHLGGVFVDNMHRLPSTLKELEFGEIIEYEDERDIPCLPLGLTALRNQFMQTVYVPNKPRRCHFEGDVEVYHNPTRHCLDSVVTVTLLPFSDNNCNGIQDSGEVKVTNVEIQIEPLNLIISGDSLQFSADYNQSLILALTANPYYTLYPDGNEMAIRTGINSDSLWITMPLCPVQQVYSNAIGRLYYDSNRNLIKDNNESYLPDIKMHSLPDGNLFQSAPDGSFNYRGTPGTTAEIGLALPSSVFYHLAEAPWHITLPATPLDTIIVGDIPVWDKGNEYGAEIDVLNLGSVSRNTKKLHETIIKNTGQEDLSGTFTWTLKNWGLNNFQDFNISPDETVRDGKDYKLIFRNFLVSAGNEVAVNFMASLVQASGTALEEAVQFIVDPTVDASDKIKYTVGAQVSTNSLEVYPERISANYIDNPGKLNYTIHFQNNGSQPVENVYIFNTIPDFLDIDQFQITGTSTPPDLKIYRYNADKYLFVWKFAGINLPPASQDSVNSAGYVSYTIGLGQSLQPRDQVKASAEIVFDSGLPAFTNDAITTYYCPQMDDLHFADPEVTYFKCFGDTAMFKVNIDSSFLPLSGQWTDQNSPTLDDRKFNLGGHYTYRLEDEALCRDSWQIDLYKPDSIEYTAVRTDSLLHLVVTGGTPPYTIVWTADTTFGEYKIVEQNGPYEFYLIDINGCTINGVVFVTSLANSQISDIKLKPYPQPAHDVLYLPEINEPTDYRIFTSTGLLVSEGSFNGKTGIDIQTIPAGTYLIKIDLPQSSFTGKFIKM